MRKKKLINKKAINPYFSIITVVKNDQKNIQKTLKSIRSQTYLNFEYIIIDGKSRDKTIDKINKFRRSVNLLISEKDKGIYYAMNKGIKNSKGKIIVFVNSGDKITKNALKIIKKKFDSKIKPDFVFGTVRRHYTKDIILKYGFNKNRLVYNFDFATAHSTGFYLKKNIFDKYGFFNTKYKFSADYDLYYRLIKKEKITGDYTQKNQLVGVVQKGGYSSKISFLKHLKEECQIRIDNGQNIIFVGLIFLNAVVKNLFKIL